MLSSPALNILQIAGGGFCAACGFGFLIALRLMRPAFAGQPAEGIRSDLAASDAAYLAIATLASVGALISVQTSLAIFIGFVCVAAAFLIAENFLLPRMKAAAEAGLAIPMLGTRNRFELLQGLLLMVLFSQISMPPLVTLARVYGI